MTFKEALEYFETKARMARKLGISPQAIQRWDDNNEIPLSRQYQIQVFTNNELVADIEY